MLADVVVVVIVLVDWLSLDLMLSEVVLIVSNVNECRTWVVKMSKNKG